MTAKSPLPDSHGSLSKDVDIEKHFRLLKQIAVDMPPSKVRALPGVDDGIYTTALKRYLFVDGGLVRRDKLISLIHEEGRLTERVRMSMYFLFMLRDARCRSFICNEVAQRNGRWSDVPLQKKNAHYPEFAKAGTSKAFTNLRWFLFQIGLLDRSFRLQKFPALSGWLFDAVDIASQHISDFEKRQLFVESPLAVLAKCDALGLLNLPSSEIMGFQPTGVSDESSDLLPIYESIGEPRPFDASAIRVWNRTAPLKRSSFTKREVLVNPALLERARSEHFVLEKLTSSLCCNSGMSVHETILIDMLARSKDVNILFEMKSCSKSNLRSQVRRGVSQLLEYSLSI